MTVAFYNPISDSFYKSICEASNFDKQVDSCIENINEFVAMIQKFHGVHNCQIKKKKNARLDFFLAILKII